MAAIGDRERGLLVHLPAAGGRIPNQQRLIDKSRVIDIGQIA